MSIVKALSIMLALAAPAGAQVPPAAADRAVGTIRADGRVAAALAMLRADEPRTVAEQRAIAELPAPPFKERARAEDVLRRLRAAGLADAAIDATGNVVARRAGSGRGPTLVLSAHLDTVFPAGDDVTVRERGARLYGRGLADDSRGLAVVLAVARALERGGLRTVGDILFVATVGEEGLGDLRGARGIVRDHPGMDGFITVEPSSDGIGQLSNGATGSRRWALTFVGPGGHSFGAFGTPSAIHAMGRAIAAIDELRVPARPKTTFNVGVVSGGTSVNTIAASARMEIDIRSDGAAELAGAERAIMAAAAAGVAAENARWGKTAAIRLERTLIGDRPAGTTPADSPLIAAGRAAVRALGKGEPRLISNSTDGNAAVAAGIPAAALPGGGRSGGAHSPEEWFEPRESWQGPQMVLLTVLALVGLEGVTPPLLAERTGR